MIKKSTSNSICCHHCGEDCLSTLIVFDAHHFCCNGCKMIYNILSQSGLTDYYKYDPNPGKSQKQRNENNYEYLDDEEVIEKLMKFKDGGLGTIVFDLPNIHCSSCLWLLENLTKLNENIVSSRVNFLKKAVSITFKSNALSLRNLVELLNNIGYPPSLKLDKLENPLDATHTEKQLLYKLGLAGFSFGNIMLLSFPEYLGIHKASLPLYIGYINLILSIPILAFSGRDYLISAWKSIKYSTPNIDVPIALGMITLFTRSTYEILSHTGTGYLDSFTGFIFFLLIGKWFQSFTVQSINYDRNYKSYFPISASIKIKGIWKSIILDKIVPGDILFIRNEELIPVDGIIQKGRARIDYSFVTGEADTISKGIGDKIFAGGKQLGNSLEIIATKKVNQSYLTKLWNEHIFDKPKRDQSADLTSLISKYFTYVIILIAILTLTYWWLVDSSNAFNSFTAVLIVACPCALALAVPFIYGNMIRILSQNGIYIKNTNTIEKMQALDTIVFDKTGTLTNNNKLDIKYNGNTLTQEQESLIKSICIHSSHPLSKALVNNFSSLPIRDADTFQEEVGKGLTAKIGSNFIKVGSSSHIFNQDRAKNENGVFIELNGTYLGYFFFEYSLRQYLESNVRNLAKKYSLYVLSGDSNKDLERISRVFSSKQNIHFNKSPKNKLDFINSLQKEGSNVMMVGDGLNDAGALMKSDVGVVISDGSNNFSPACDVIIAGTSFKELHAFMLFVKCSKYIVYTAFVFAFLYNIVGLYFATTGQLSPVIAAILMPLSSISIIAFGLISTFLASKYFLTKKTLTIN